MAQNPLQIPDVDNEVLQEADEYLRKHKILELFEVSIDPKKLIILFISGLNHYSCLQTTREHGGVFERHPQAEKDEWKQKHRLLRYGTPEHIHPLRPQGSWLYH